MKRKKKSAPKQTSTREQLTKLHARVWFLEQVERREAAYRGALAVVRRREAQLKEANAALTKAATAFLEPYAPQELTFTHDPSRTGSTVVPVNTTFRAGAPSQDHP